MLLALLDGTVGDISARITGLQAPPFLAMCKFLAFRALGDVDPAERPGEFFSLGRALLITLLNHLCILSFGHHENDMRSGESINFIRFAKRHMQTELRLLVQEKAGYVLRLIMT